MRRFFLFLLFAFPASAQTITKNGDRYDFKVGDELVTSYHVGKDVVKPYLWPLNAPGSVGLTRGWPQAENNPGDKTKDHPHHKSAWFCHGDVIPVGLEMKARSSDKRVEGVDFWSEAKGHGRIVCVRSDAKGGALETANEWVAPDGQKVLDETRTIRVAKAGKGFLVTMDTVLAATVCPIIFGDTKEGSFGIRVGDTINEKDGKGVMTNAEGKTGEKAVWGFISPWLDYSGKTHDGKEAGVAIFASPKNGVPSAWHSRSYGLHSANPFGRGGHAGFPAYKDKKADLVKLDKGESLKLTYAIYLHPGDVKTGDVAEAYKAFAGK